MNNLMTFTDKEFGQLRTIETDKGVYFVGKDLALMLGYKNPHKALVDNVAISLNCCPIALGET